MTWILTGVSADARRLLATRGLRGLDDGAISVILPSYLAIIGFNSLEIGAIVFGTLLGSAALTLLVGLTSHRHGQRVVLLAASLLMLLTGVGFFAVTTFWPLFVVAVIGTMNPSAGDVSLFLPAEQTALADAVATTNLTTIFGLYNVSGALAGAIGALLSGIPAQAAHATGLTVATADRVAFLGYSLIAVAVAVFYWRLKVGSRPKSAAPRASGLTRSRSIAVRLSILFSIDAFGGGFVVQALLALWLFRRFDLKVETVGIFFFAAGLLGALSQLLSSVIAARIGRIRTMAYTHLPANLLLMLAALMPGPRLALALLLARASMSSMDVPARQSYVMAVVDPEERAAAASVTNVPRSLASAFAPLPSGALINASTFGWPLICGGGLKIIYDVLLLLQFRATRPADEI
jgi:predicted MFS family arabinose efflux permease